MSHIQGLCPSCARPIMQMHCASSGFRYLACFKGHAWKEVSGDLEPFRPPQEESAPKQIVIPASQWKVTVPKQPEAFRWCYKKSEEDLS